MIVIFSQEHINIPNLIIDGAVIEHVSTSKLLGVYISDDLTWHVRIKEIHKGLVGSHTSSYYSTHLEHQLKTSMKFSHIELETLGLIRPIAEYACPILHTRLIKNQSKLLVSIQKRAMNIIKPNMKYTETLAFFNIQRDRPALC